MTALRLKTLPLLLSALPIAALAQSTIPAEQQVLVTAPKPVQPLSAARLDSASLPALRRAGADSAALLREIPGVTLYGAGGASSLPAIHGLADDRLRIVVDGMDLVASCPNHMNPPLSYLDPEQVAAIRVWAGITPVSVGGDSLGGTVVAETTPPEFAAAGEAPRAGGRLGVHARSNNNARGASLAAHYATEVLALSYSGAISRAGNSRAAADFKTSTVTGRSGHTLPLDEVGSTAYDTRNQQIGLALRDATQLLEVKLGLQDVPYQLYPNQRMDMLDNQQRRLNLHYRGQFGWGTLDARVFRETVDHYMDFGADKQFTYGPNPPSTIVAPGMPMYTAGRTTGATVKAEIPWGAQDLLRAGIDTQAYRLNDWWPPSPADLTGMVSAPGVPATSGGMAPDTFWNIRDGQRDRIGVYAEWERQWNPQWLHLLGLRSDRVTTDTGKVQGYNTVMAGYAASAAAFNARDHHRRDNNLDLTALARYTPAETTALEIGYARKSRSPNLYERYSWSQNSMALIMNNFVGDGNGYLGNLDLKPEVAHTLSASAEWHDAAPQGRALKATVYATYVKDFIDAVRCAGSGMMMNALCGGAANNTAVGKFVNLQYANQSAHLAGLDVSGRLPLADNGWGRWGLEGVLTLTHARNGVTDDAPYNTLPRQGRLTLTHALTDWDSGLELEMVGAKQQVSEVRNEVKTAGYALLHLRVGHRWGRLRIDAGIDNLLDKAYALPLGGAYVGQGMTMSSNGVPWGIAVPGMGRSVYAGMSLAF